MRYRELLPRSVSRPVLLDDSNLLLGFLPLYLPHVLLKLDPIQINDLQNKNVVWAYPLTRRFLPF